MEYKIYELKLKPLSPWITDLTADTIFGHLCWQIKYDFWNETLEKFLQEMSENPIFTISDVLPADRLPRPMTEWDGDMWEQNNEDFETNKNYKKINFIFQKTFKKEFLNKNILEKEKIWEIKKNIEDEKLYHWLLIDIENKNIINRSTENTLEWWIFSIETNNIKNSSYEIRTFIKIFDEEKFKNYKILDLLKVIFETTWFWKKKSTWKWVFKIESIDKNFIENFYGEKNINDLKNILVLSNFIPSKDDSINWNYKIFTKFPKMWEEFSSKWQNFYKKPMIMIEKWATFEKKENYNWYVWTMKKDIAINRKNIYHYAYGFTLEF